MGIDRRNRGSQWITAISIGGPRHPRVDLQYNRRYTILYRHEMACAGRMTCVLLGERSMAKTYNTYETKLAFRAAREVYP